MKDWFTVEKIDEDTYAISEYQHWEETHCYLLCGTKRALLIDTGLGVANIKEVVDKLTMLPIFVVTTHVHWDHIGGHQYFENIGVHILEKDWISEKFPISLQQVKRNLTCRECQFPEEFDLEKYQLFQGDVQSTFSDGEIFNLGERTVQVVDTPGHSPGHCCFYEAKRGYLYSGDLIYSGCLDIFYPTTDPKQFWQSVKKVQSLHLKHILPGHHSFSVSTDLADRIEGACRKLDKEKKWKQGSGIFDFGDFKIHL